MNHPTKYFLFFLSLFIVFAFDEPDLIKPLHVKTITEYCYHGYKNKQSDVVKVSTTTYSKDGRILKNIGYFGSDSGVAEYTYNTKLQPNGLIVRYGKDGKDRKDSNVWIMNPYKDTVDVFIHKGDFTLKGFYIFNKQHVAIAYWHDWAPAANPGYKAIYENNKLTSMQYFDPLRSLDFDGLPFQIAEYTYIKKDDSLTVRQKIVRGTDPGMVAPAQQGYTLPEKETPSEYVTFNNKNEIIQKAVISTKYDTAFYSYKYEYYKK